MRWPLLLFWCLMYRICVQPNGRAGSPGEQQSLLHDAHTLGITSLSDVQIATLYFVQGNLTPQQVDYLCYALFADPLTETVTWQLSTTAHQPQAAPVAPGVWVVEVGLHPGVTDPVANQIEAMAVMLGMPHLRAATGRRYVLSGSLDEQTVHTLARRLLCNETIHTYYLGPMSPAFPQPARSSHHATTVSLSQLSDSDLVSLSRQRLLALSLDEMRAIRGYFAAAGRDPTDVELETLAQTWSEHCVHKTFKAIISLQEPGSNQEIGRIDGLLRTYIRAATDKVSKPWVRSAFVDNAGIIDFDDHYDVSFKVETHNHPSALEPFGGANTGVGGVVRDVIGVSARPIAVTDVLCFGPQDMSLADVPEGSLHPRRVKAGVVAGIQDYGNKLGLPTVSGAILYDEGFTANPLVFAGCLGLAPKGSHPLGPQPGDLVVVIGGRTGRDGLHGATFSSEELTHETGDIAGTAVQIGDPIVEKDVIEVVCLARDAHLYSAITDCGAGGLSSAVGELGRRLGVDVELAQVPLKYPGLQPWEIWLSEAQERMVLAVPPAKWPALQTLCHDWNVQATAIGTFTGDERLVVRYDGTVVADIAMDFLHEGLPRLTLQALWPKQDGELPAAPGSDPCQQPRWAGLLGADSYTPAGLRRSLLALLAHPNIASKEQVIRRYDHEVGGGTLVKPLTGAANDGPSDAAVLKPLQTWEHNKGLVLSLGINPQIGKVDPYAMAISAVDEAIRNAVAVGADPDQIALLDNFCWGNPRRPEQLGGLVRAAQGCYDAAVAYGTPFISGKDSLNNEYLGRNGERIPIPGTLLISALGIIPNVHKAVTMDLKQEGDVIFLVGETRDELAGSHYAMIVGVPTIPGREVLGEEQFWSAPPSLPEHGLDHYRALHRAMQQGLVRACHDVSEGGVAVAAAEMCIAGRLGMQLHLPDDDPVVSLFSESNGRLLVEVSPDQIAAFRATMQNCPLSTLGTVAGQSLHVSTRSGELLFAIELGDLLAAWQGGES